MTGLTNNYHLVVYIELSYIQSTRDLKEVRRWHMAWGGSWPSYDSQGALLQHVGCTREEGGGSGRDVPFIPGKNQWAIPLIAGGLAGLSRGGLQTHGGESVQARPGRWGWRWAGRQEKCLSESWVGVHHQRPKPRLGNPKGSEQKVLRLRINK